MAEQSGPVIALVSPGAMGSAVAARLGEHGARVVTSLKGRSARSAARAAEAGMVDVPDEQLVRADIILSILPPADAEAMARRLIPHLAATAEKPLYVDFNALGPDSKQALAALFAEAGCTMIDGAIIGLPPRRGETGPSFHVAGPEASRAAWLGNHGLDLRLLDGPIGAAAALKMCFAGLNKGLVGLASAMLLAGQRSESGHALHGQLEERMPELLGRFRLQIPDMYGKAYRWVAEMWEIADFLRDDPAAAMIFEGMAQLFERLAADAAGNRSETAMLDRALRLDGGNAEGTG